MTGCWHGNLIQMSLQIHQRLVDKKLRDSDWRGFKTEGEGKTGG